MSLYDQIPGYKEARDIEQANRDLAFLDLPVPLCGLLVKQFSLKHLILLGNCGNRFAVPDGMPEPEDIAQFLWIVSTEYSLDADKRDKFVRGLRKLKYGAALAEINAYLERAFQDSPQGAKHDGPIYTASCASLVDLIANEYGWSDTAICEKPIARLFQYQRTILKRHNPKALHFNRSDRLISEWGKARSGGAN